MCAAPKQGPQSLPAGVDLEKETVITGKVVDGSGKVIIKIPKLSGKKVYRVRLDVNDRPSRYLAVRSVQPA